jgi:hypothetical protein
MNISRRQYWSLAATVFLFFTLLNVVKVQDIVAHAFGYSGSVPMFDLDERIRGYTPAQVFDVLTAYGETGRRAYAFLLLTSDLVFPFLYGSFLFLSIRRVAERAGTPALWAKWLEGCGLAAACFDWLENISFITLMRIYPVESTRVAKLASSFTVTKFVFSGVSLLVLAILGTYILFKSVRPRSLTRSS